MCALTQIKKTLKDIEKHKNIPEGKRDRCQREKFGKEEGLLAELEALEQEKERHSISSAKKQRGKQVGACCVSPLPPAKLISGVHTPLPHRRVPQLRAVTQSLTRQ